MQLLLTGDEKGINMDYDYVMFRAKSLPQYQEILSITNEITGLL